MKKKLLVTTGFIAFAVLFFAVLSQFYSPDEQIFITDSYFITPKSQPVHFILMWLATIFLILLAIYLGKVIAAFLWSKGLLFLVVGGFLFLGAAFLAYFTIYLRMDTESIAGLITMGIIVLFKGGLGAMMVILPLIKKKK